MKFTIGNVLISLLAIKAPLIAAAPANDGSTDPNEHQDERTGRVIIGYKSDKRLREEGRNLAQVAGIRSLMPSMELDVVFESDDDHKYEVVEVGIGNEESFIEELVQSDVNNLIAYAEPDLLCQPASATQTVLVTPNDPLLQGNDYHHQLMQNYEAWALHTGSPSVTVGICDTGLGYHPDLDDNRLEGYDAVHQLWEGQGGSVSPNNSHGTRCAGCAAAIGNNGEGGVGVGWNLKHRPGRVTNFSSGFAYDSQIIDCVR